MKRFMALLLSLLLFPLCAMGELPDPEREAAVQSLAAELLPGYTLRWGDVRRGEEVWSDAGMDAASFLAVNPAGETVLVGCLRSEDGWTLTESMPLPAESCIEYHSLAFSVNVQLPRPELDQLGDRCWVTYSVDAQADGSWRITGFRDDGGAVHTLDDWCISREEDLSVCFGALPCPLDMAEADWLALPATWEQAVDLLGKPPIYTVLDGCIFEQTAMLLLEDAEGQAYFAGCARTEAGWEVTLSTALPDESICRFYEGGASLYFDHPVLMAKTPDDPDCCFRIRLQENGSWSIREAENLIFEEGYVWTEQGQCCYGTRCFSLDMAEADWLNFPLTWEEVINRMDTADRAILASEASLYDARGGQPLARYNPGTPLLILQRRDGWYEVAILGGGVSGWIEAEHLIVGHAQKDAVYLTLEDLPMLCLGRHQAEIPVLLLPDGPTLVSLDGGQDQILYIMGAWEGWVHVYDRDLPGMEGFIREEDLIPLENVGLG